MTIAERKGRCAALLSYHPRPPAAGMKRLKGEKPVPGGGGLGRPQRCCGIGQDARQGARPAGPSSDLPRVTRLAFSLADKAGLIGACPRPARLGLPRRQPLHNRHYANLARVSQGNARVPAAPVRPLKGGSPRRTPLRACASLLRAGSCDLSIRNAEVSRFDTIDS